MVMLRNCCCGCTLKQGTIGSGIWTTIQSIINIGLGVVLILFRVPEHNKVKVEEAEKYIRYVGIYLVILGSLRLIVSICLFVAVIVKNRALFFPWLIFQAIILNLSIGGAVWLVINAEFLTALGVLVDVALMIYLLIVVISYYQTDMGRDMSEGRNLNLAPNTVFTPVPQQPDVQYQPSYPMTTVPPSQPAGPALYPTQTYNYAQKPYSYTAPHGGQPPPFPTNV